MRGPLWFRGARRGLACLKKSTVLFTILACAVPAYGQSFTLVDLGTGAPNSFGSAIAINNVYPNYSIALNEVGGSPVLIDADRTRTFLPHLGGGISYSSAVNDARTVAGYSTLPTGASRAVLWLNGGEQLVNLGVLFPDRNPTSSAAALNNNSNVQVTGWVSFDVDDVTRVAHAFLWQSGTMVDILPGDYQTTARGINDLGQVVGQRVASRGSYGEAYLWSNGTVTNLGHLGAYQGIPNSLAFGINNNQTVVGNSTNPINANRAFAWHPDDRRMMDLGTLPGRTGATAYGINNYELVVGSSSDVRVPPRAFIVGSRAYRPMIDLNNLVIAPGWELSYAFGVNDQNQIVGLGVVNFQLRGFLLLPIQADSPALRKARTCAEILGKALLVRGGAEATKVALDPRTPVWGRILGAVGQFLIGAALGLVMINCGGDPFDQNYPTVYTPQFRGVPPVPDLGSGCPAGLADTMNQALARGARAVSYIQAISVTLNRAQSAFMFGDTQSFSAQDQALGNYEASANSELTAYQSGLRNIASAIQGSACDLTLTRADIEQFIADVQAQGIKALPDDELRLFDTYQIDPWTTIPLYAGLDASQVPLSLSDGLTTTAQGIGVLANLFAALPRRQYRAHR